MMTVKAYIVQLPDEGSNEFLVRIPYLEGNTNSEVIYSALLCNQPGNYDGYKVGDCVFVTFEDTRLNVPIILGKLYTSREDVDSSVVVNNLSVTGVIDLPATTTIGGYSTVDIFKNYQKDNTSTLDASNLDYDVVDGSDYRLLYDEISRWEYTSEQEKYCRNSYQVYDVLYVIAE